MEGIMNAYAIPGMPFPRKELSMSEIVEVVCEYQQISANRILKRNSKSDMVYVRALCFYVLWLTDRFTLKDIGAYFHKDHKSIMHGRDAFIDQISLKFNNKYKEDSEYIIGKLGMSGKERRSKRRKSAPTIPNPNTHSSNT